MKAAINDIICNYIVAAYEYKHLHNTSLNYYQSLTITIFPHYLTIQDENVWESAQRYWILCVDQMIKHILTNVFLKLLSVKVKAQYQKHIMVLAVSWIAFIIFAVTIYHTSETKTYFYFSYCFSQECNLPGLLSLYL